MSFLSNHQKTTFYPIEKKPNSGVGPNSRFDYTQVDDSLELALLTLNLTHPRYKTMEKHELETYVRSLAFCSGEQRKHLLALNILLKDMSKSGFIKQNPYSTEPYVPNFPISLETIPTPYSSKPKPTTQDTDLTYIESEEFTLDIPLTRSNLDNISIRPQQSSMQHNFNSPSFYGNKPIVSSTLDFNRTNNKPTQYQQQIQQQYHAAQRRRNNNMDVSGSDPSNYIITN
ncbi:MAG: hypothetical protein Gaeavirus28_3 [Gaeavirus sp.]|uniref:Uncharacterized protein n=1 Tax=Gaeavirus sp. TaxID=2487767 RepID=A0A3G5A1C6_9VIRU|nr:MAG: hypothetical protein Gaeavirus28_3 [Gaeavirus sp.]